MKNLTSKFKQANPTVQYVIAGAGLFIAYKIYKLLFKNEQQQTNQQIVQQAEKEKKELEKKFKLTFPVSQYPIFANLIYESTKYGIGDNYGAVVDTLKKLKNDLDVATLIKAYGSRQNYIFGIPAGEKRDLFTNIKAELGNEYGGLTSYRISQINNDWQKKGIKYRV
jgi:cell shape-determining protein MreC